MKDNIQRQSRIIPGWDLPSAILALFVRYSPSIDNISR